MFLLKLFTANPLAMLWVGLAVFAAGAASGGSAAWTVNGWRLGTQVEHAQKELETCKGSLGRTQDANEAFAGAVTNQTASIQALAAATVARDARIQKALDDAAKLGLTMNSKADELMKRPLPATAAEDCQALAADIDELIRERQGRTK